MAREKREPGTSVPISQSVRARLDKVCEERMLGARLVVDRAVTKLLDEIAPGEPTREPMPGEQTLDAALEPEA